ncbi:maleylpyruvate isomerase, partial [Mycobacteroides abscessus]
MNLFTHSWAALRAAVADLPIQAFAQPSGCAG